MNHRLAYLIILSLCAKFATSQEVGLTPMVDLSVHQDSNIYRTSAEVDGTIIQVAPEFAYATQYGKHDFQALYKGNYAKYQDNNNLDYFEHEMFAKAKLDLSHKFASDLGFGYQDSIEQPGSTNALSQQLDELNQRTTKGISASLFYGTKQSTGQLVGKYAYKQLEYTNNGQAFRDYNSDTVTGTFFYRVAPKTRLLLEASAAQLGYQNTQFVDNSSRQTSYLAGVEWNATAITSSTFKIGYQDVDYDVENLADLSGLSYFLDMVWKPNTYSILKIGASRAARESAEQSLGGYISSEYDINLAHEFTSNTQFSIGYRYTDFDYNNNQSRKDELKNLTAKLSYQSKYWLQLYIEYENSKRDSELEFYNYDASIVTLGANASF
ncbi:outer membrane beta-barrel protein [uncultured Paraglaciecola sp.]|uniref:outer membrane beta-barrel protein n=1 Tax=uncultured Paraglaciecola sp. TaxID=1765024 RepID=UPI0030DC9CCD|tara:strand:+ start:2965 stop:4107 length:1143 start_codon:yes stop_codon:yes gene_type:complete